MIPATGFSADILSTTRGEPLEFDPSFQLTDSAQGTTLQPDDHEVESINLLKANRITDGEAVADMKGAPTTDKVSLANTSIADQGEDSDDGP